MARRIIRFHHGGSGLTKQVDTTTWRGEADATDRSIELRTIARENPHAKGSAEMGCRFVVWDSVGCRAVIRGAAGWRCAASAAESGYGARHFAIPLTELDSRARAKRGDSGVVRFPFDKSPLLLGRAMAARLVRRQRFGMICSSRHCAKS